MLGRRHLRRAKGFRRSAGRAGRSPGSSEASRTRAGMIGLVTATRRRARRELSRVKSRLGSGGMTKLCGGASRATTPLRSAPRAAGDLLVRRGRRSAPRRAARWTGRAGARAVPAPARDPTCCGIDGGRHAPPRAPAAPRARPSASRRNTALRPRGRAAPRRTRRAPPAPARARGCRRRAARRCCAGSAA